MITKFAKLMFGPKMFMELLNEIASINNLTEFLIIINHDNYNYRIKALYSNDLKKISYPKRFRKTVYDAEPTSTIIMNCEETSNEDYYDEEYEAFDYRRDWSGCLCYHIKINSSDKGSIINMTQESMPSAIVNESFKEMEEGKSTKFIMNYRFNRINSIIYNL